MDHWNVMFAGVQDLARASRTVEEGLRRTVDLALAHPEHFGSPAGYWERVERHLPRFPVTTVTEWARDALGSMGEGSGWELTLLDLGDCPETFDLYSPGSQELLDERRVREWLFSDTVLGPTALEDFFVHPVEDPFRQLFADASTYWSEHSTCELNDPILTWSRDGSLDYNGNSGYLLWLAVGSLALMAPLRDREYCRRVLAGRERLYLLSGFEEIFFYVGTVTHEGLVVEGCRSGSGTPSQRQSPGQVGRGDCRHRERPYGRP